MLLHLLAFSDKLAYQLQWRYVDVMFTALFCCPPSVSVLKNSLKFMLIRLSLCITTWVYLPPILREQSSQCQHVVAAEPRWGRGVSWPGGTTGCTVWCCWLLYWGCSSSLCPQSSATSSSTLLDETTVCLCAIACALCIPQEVLYVLLMLQLIVPPISFFWGCKN